MNASERVVITQGEQFISDDPFIVISTLLGSCVSCCLWDPIAAVGGMNHMLLAENSVQTGLGDSAGINAMELLINGVLKMGGRRDRLQAKAFGGSNMIQAKSSIGSRNASFTLAFLERENIPCLAQSLGGSTARHLLFSPTTGAAQQKRAAKMVEAPVAPPVQALNGVDLF